MTPPAELLNELIEGEQAFPIFNVHARWSQDIDGDRDVSGYGPKWFEGLPEGRLWNCTGWSEMPQEVTTRQSIIREAKHVWWPQFKVTEKMQNMNPLDLEITVELKRWETWCMGWFSHWTWEIGLDDGQVLHSFERYVDRTEELNRKEGEVVAGHFQEPYCLMGAEDRWRWSGRTEGKGDDERTDPPCRCPHCKERGVVTIAH